MRGLGGSRTAVVDRVIREVPPVHLFPPDISYIYVFLVSLL